MHGEVKSPPFSADARIKAGTLLRQLQGGHILGLAALAPDAGGRPTLPRTAHSGCERDMADRLPAGRRCRESSSRHLQQEDHRDTQRRAGRLTAPSQGLRPGDSQGARTMKHTKRVPRLEAHGWRVGSAQAIPRRCLAAEEAALVETKLRLSRAVRERRAKLAQSQAALAKRLHSSQSRVAKMEAADPTVSVDLLLKALFALPPHPRPPHHEMWQQPFARRSPRPRERRRQHPGTPGRRPRGDRVAMSGSRRVAPLPPNLSSPCQTGIIKLYLQKQIPQIIYYITA